MVPAATARDSGLRVTVHRDAWQEDGAFSLNPAQRETVIHYIDTQAEHHRKWSFEQEFMTY